MKGYNRAKTWDDHRQSVYRYTWVQNACTSIFIHIRIRAMCTHEQCQEAFGCLCNPCVQVVLILYHIVLHNNKKQCQVDCTRRLQLDHRHTNYREKPILAPFPRAESNRRIQIKYTICTRTRVYDIPSMIMELGAWRGS